MSQTDSRMLVLGALAGVAGVSLAAVCYRGFRSRRRSSWAGFGISNGQGTSLMLVDGPGLQTGQAEVLERLEALIRCVSELKEEMKLLKDALPTLQGHVRDERRGHERGSPLHRTTPTRRKRAPAALGGARGGGGTSEEAESEGGYITALTDSEEEELSDSDQDDQHQPGDELYILLRRIDRLHQGTDSDKRESLHILLEQREQFGQNSAFLWRLMRAYSDVHDISSTLEEKKTHAERGKQIGEEAVSLNPSCAESHQWFAIMCGIMTDYDTMQNKIKNGYIFKVTGAKGPAPFLTFSWIHLLLRLVDVSGGVSSVTRSPAVSCIGGGVEQHVAFIFCLSAETEGDRVPEMVDME
ncbi:hypothetical protein fugu_012692 [Takifugu bimaculatus]|uniref:Regulator of microtubule dynamics protein 2 n=1 Tax=Takifugu bimaculatus TaxID=433685 RepID=A0A4Z2C634_9TELE|nr:hypothetical protein fugu_012692 [Takifugu bimaculatus]